MGSRLLCVLCLTSLAVVAVRCRTTGPSLGGNDIPDARVKPEAVTGYMADIRGLLKLYEECSAGEFAVSTCLKKKVVVVLDRASRTSKKLWVMDGVDIVKDVSVEDSAPVDEQELDASLPRTIEDRDSALNQMIFDKIIHFFKSHTVQLKLVDDESRSLGEGRRRRVNSLLMYPLMLGGTFIPLAFGALALLAGKALIVSKLALALAAIVGLKKLVGSGGGESYQVKVVHVPQHGGGHYKRSLGDSEAQELVYRGYLIPHTETLQGA